jgi:hypothetical protein
MSRGLGKLQRDIIHYIETCRASTTYESLRWALLEQKRHPVTRSSPNADPCGMPGSWNSSLTRALDGLVRHGSERVIIERRRLASMDEFVEHYPGKTLVAKTRKLRINLLPALAQIARTGEHPIHFSQADNERWFVENQLRDKLADFQRAWNAIEPELMTHLPRLAGEDQARLFLLIARAKSLFERAPLECRRSIDECLGPLSAHGALPPAILKRISEFSESVLPPDQIGFLRLKSIIGSFVSIPATGSGCHLKDETLDALERACPEVQYFPNERFHRVKLQPIVVYSFRLLS